MATENRKIKKIINDYMVPRGVRVATLGDSRLGKSWGTSYNKYGNGIVYWTEMLTRGVAYFPFELAFAVSGYTTTQSLPQSKLCAQSNADVVMIFCDINDTTLRQAANITAVSVNQTLINIDTMVKDQLRGGKLVILFSGSPAGPTAGSVTEFSGIYLNQNTYIAQWMRDKYKTTDRVHVVDVWPDWGDMTSATGYANSTSTYDNLHPSATGAYQAAVKIKKIFDIYYPYSFEPLISTGADLYSAANNPLGALNSNPMLTGTTGTAGANTSGQFATGWTASTTDAGLTVVGSKVSSGGKIWQQFVISGTPTTANPNLLFRQTETIGQFAIGDKFYASCEIEVDSGSANCYTPYLSTRVQGASITDLASSGELGTSGHTDGVGPSFAYSGVLITDAAPITAGNVFTAADTRFGVYTVQNAAASMTVRVARIAKRKRIPA